ncbi:tRNA lysidine(34) synthetase TilS [Sphingobium olei]|uniref:tRNA(Ile)-lysidine synthase n=1 Tax=Sphingobium olei TaxID=420955 RepID=A0ABW3P4K1_9SPHN
MQLGSDRAALEALLAQAVAALTGADDAARFGIAVSGGPDSMALLSLAARLYAGRVEAVTVDHQLRPEAAEEAAMVARWCAGAGVPHAILTPDAPVTGNVQNWARIMRYRLIEQWGSARGIDWIMTAHHADDQLETMIMRLNRGSGVAGLAGVRARTGRVIRPLLGVRKAALVTLAQAQGLPFVDDPSNVDRRFDRAALRAVLAGVDWIDAEAAGRSAAALAEAEAALAWSVEALAAAHVRQEGAGWRLERTDLPREYLRRLLLHMLALADPEAPAPRGEAIDRAIAQALAGGKSSLGGWLLTGGESWTLMPAPARR